MAELVAIEKAVSIIKFRNESRNYIIYTDSLSAISAINTSKRYAKSYIVHRIREAIESVKGTLELIWIPSHMQIKGNDLADEMAKEGATQTDIIDVEEEAGNLIEKLQKQSYKEWQKQWSTQRWTLNRNKPILGDYPTMYQSNRRDEVIMARLRMGICNFTHQHYWTGSEPLHCIRCSLSLTIEHILISCPEYEQKRTRLKEISKEFNKAFELSNILAPEYPVVAITQFLKEIKLYEKI